VNVNPARRLTRALGELEIAERSVDGSDEPLAAELAYALCVVTNGGEPAPIILLPLRVLLSEEAILVVHAHNSAFRDESL